MSAPSCSRPISAACRARGRPRLELETVGSSTAASAVRRSTGAGVDQPADCPAAGASPGSRLLGGGGRGLFDRTRAHPVPHVEVQTLGAAILLLVVRLAARLVRGDGGGSGLLQALVRLRL